MDARYMAAHTRYNTKEEQRLQQERRDQLTRHAAQQPQPLTFGGLTSSPDTRLLEFIDPDAPKCVN